MSAIAGKGSRNRAFQPVVHCSSASVTPSRTGTGCRRIRRSPSRRPRTPCRRRQEGESSTEAWLPTYDPFVHRPRRPLPSARIRNSAHAIYVDRCRVYDAAEVEQHRLRRRTAAGCRCGSRHGGSGRHARHPLRERTHRDGLRRCLGSRVPGSHPARGGEAASNRIGSLAVRSWPPSVRPSRPIRTATTGTPRTPSCRRCPKWRASTAATPSVDVFIDLAVSAHIRCSALEAACDLVERTMRLGGLDTLARHGSNDSGSLRNQ